MKRRGFLKRMGVAGTALIGAELAAHDVAAVGKSAALWRGLRERQIGVSARFATYDGARPLRSIEVDLDGGRPARGDLDGAAWSITAGAGAIHDRADAIELRVRFRLARGKVGPARVSLALTFPNWSRDNYVLLPGACYRGNRFEARHIGYPPLLTEPADIGPHVPTIVSEVPRLNLRAGASRVALLAGDLATPAIGFQAPRDGTGFWLLTDPMTTLGMSGLSIEESEDRRTATIMVTAPGTRDESGYRKVDAARSAVSSPGATLKAGTDVVLRARLYLFDCPEVQGLFDRFVTIRKDISGAARLRHERPLSASWKIHETSYNRDRWVERQGYFAVAGRETPYTDWQTGWCGGVIATLPLLLAGEPLSRERALRSFDFLFDDGQAKSGFFHAMSDGENWFDDGVAVSRTGERDSGPAINRAGSQRNARRWHLIRRSADVLYFMTKQLVLLERQEPPVKVKAAWTKGVGRCADAFVKLWDRNRQLGQFVNVDTGDIVVGGSAAGGMAPAGLALASQYFKRPEYLRVAQEAAQLFYDKFVRAGVTTGGPPDALQCPDSESALGLLESFVVLYEVTGEVSWADRATEIAHQLASWVVSYDLPAQGSRAASKPSWQTTGAVLPSVQSPAASPGFVTASGDALFKLYRATGNVIYMNLLRDTAHNLTQYVVDADQASARAAASGQDGPGERIEAGRPPTAGELLPPSVALEVCSLLTYAEVPGVYVETDAGTVFVVDHVVASIKEKTAETLVVTIKNPTAMEAVVRVVAEGAAEKAKPLGVHTLAAAQTVTLAPGAEQSLTFPRAPS